MTLYGDKIVVTGRRDTDDGTYSDMFLLRYNPDGSLDTTFGGGDGRARFSFEGRLYDAAQDVAKQRDGKLLVTGQSYLKVGDSSTSNFVLARLEPDGVLDKSFGGGDGKVITNFAGDREQAHAVVSRAGGGAIVVGEARNAANTRGGFALAAYTPSGSLDLSFGGGDGKVKTYFFAQEDFAYAYDAVRQADGKLVVAGDSFDRLLVARYLPVSGELDPSFGGGDGKVKTDVTAGGNCCDQHAYAADIGGPGSKLVVAGSYGDFSDALLARYLLE